MKLMRRLFPSGRTQWCTMCGQTTVHVRSEDAHGQRWKRCTGCGAQECVGA